MKQRGQPKPKLLIDMYLIEAAVNKKQRIIQIHSSLNTNPDKIPWHDP